MSDPESSFYVITSADYEKDMSQWTYAVLTEDRNGYKETGILAKFAVVKPYSDKMVLAGNLLQVLMDDEVAATAAHCQPPLNYKVVTDNAIKLHCQPAWIHPLTTKQKDLLLAVNSIGDRSASYQNVEWVETLQVGSIVMVKVPHISHPVRSTIRCIFRLSTEGGILFGVELLEKESKGKGSTDGYFKGYQHFKCEHDCAVFVAMDKLIKPQRSSSPRTRRSPSPVKHQPKAIDIPLKKGDRVVAFDDQGKPVKGTVQWIGKNELSMPDRTAIVGIYTDDFMVDINKRFPTRMANMDHIIPISTKHTRLFLPIDCFLKDDGQERSNISAEQGHKYNTRHPEQNRTYHPSASRPGATSNPQDRDVLGEAERARRRQAAQDWKGQDEQEPAIHGERRNKQLQIKDELQIGEMEGFDDTMLDPERQNEILKKINLDKDHDKVPIQAQQDRNHQSNQQQVENPTNNYVQNVSGSSSAYPQPQARSDGHLQQNNMLPFQNNVVQSNPSNYQLQTGPPGQQWQHPQEHYPAANYHDQAGPQPGNHQVQIPSWQQQQQMGREMEHQQAHWERRQQQPEQMEWQHQQQLERERQQREQPHQQSQWEQQQQQQPLRRNGDQQQQHHLNWQQQHWEQQKLQQQQQQQQQPINWQQQQQDWQQQQQQRLQQQDWQQQQQQRQQQQLQHQQQQREQQPEGLRGILRAGEDSDTQGPAPPMRQYSNADGYQRKQHAYEEMPGPRLSEGSMVQCGDNPTRYGVIKWIGYLRGSTSEVAGVELDQPIYDSVNNNGAVGDCQYFHCQAGHGLFVKLNALRPDLRFSEPQSEAALKPVNPLGEFQWATDDDGETFYQAMKDVNVHKGRGMGIQGHQNSCYLDSTLYGMFSYSEVFDDLVLKQKTTDPIEINTKTLLRQIVNLLRRRGVVHYNAIMSLRTALDKLQQLKGLKSEEKDPEEFLNLLFKYVLHVEAFLKIRRPSGEDKEYFVQLFVEQDKNIIPNTQLLLCDMFLDQNISFVKYPLRLLLQIPRYGKQFKSFKGVIPSLELDVSMLCEDVAGPCFVCDQPGEAVCGECNKDMLNKNEVQYFCKRCFNVWHEHPKRQHHKLVPRKASNIDTGRLQLLSVLCIETSHYVCFTRVTGYGKDEWVFFDSMADRPDDVHNMPEVTVCTNELNEWVYGKKDLTQYSSKDLPPLVRRFVEDGYLCIYVDHDGIMYGDDA